MNNYNDDDYKKNNNNSLKTEVVNKELLTRLGQVFSKDNHIETALNQLSAADLARLNWDNEFACLLKTFFNARDAVYLWPKKKFIELGGQPEEYGIALHGEENWNKFKDFFKDEIQRQHDRKEE